MTEEKLSTTKKERDELETERDDLRRSSLSFHAGSQHFSFAIVSTTSFSSSSSFTL